MYDVREVVIGQGEMKRKRLVIEFNHPSQEILGEFLMTDVSLLGGEMVQEIKEILHGDRESVIGSGNRCGWKIDSEKAVINDLFADMGEGIPVLPTCTIETRQLYELILMWEEKRAIYNSN